MFEVEIKSLLGDRKRAKAVRSAIQKSGAKALGKHRQLNHYFVVPPEPRVLLNTISPLLDEPNRTLLAKILLGGTKISLRTRQADGRVRLVAKASVGDDTSANGVSRLEIEASVKKPLAELDALLLSAGATYEAKWSREREEYRLGDLMISIDKNAGYGYLAEFEKQVRAESEIASAKDNILRFMKEIGVEELPQDRLERTFRFYNEHWQEYYGTDKAFIIE
jgi:predicted adenylyl cyclase CyaB